MEKRQVAFVICTIVIALVGIASVQMGIRQYMAQEAVALGSSDTACPSCTVNFSATATASSAPSQSPKPVSSKSTPSTSPVKQSMTVVFYWQPNCPHCDNMRPSIEQIKSSYPAVHLVFSNTAADIQSAQAHKVTVVPTTIAFVDGKEASRYAGEFDVATLEQQLDTLIGEE